MSSHTVLGAHTNAHMSAHTSFGAHTSAHMSVGAHTSARMCTFLPRDPICPISPADPSPHVLFLSSYSYPPHLLLVSSSSPPHILQSSSQLLLILSSYSPCILNLLCLKEVKNKHTKS